MAELFGSSRHVMSGPTNANSLALFAVLTPLAVAGSPGYIELALAVTVLVGLMQWLVGALRLGSLAHFISPSALFGFTSGAALLIAVHALKDAPVSYTHLDVYKRQGSSRGSHAFRPGRPSASRGRR